MVSIFATHIDPYRFAVFIVMTTILNSLVHYHDYKATPSEHKINVSYIYIICTGIYIYIYTDDSVMSASVYNTMAVATQNEIFSWELHDYNNYTEFILQV